MIIVLFVPGSFGSTIEYSLRQFSNELCCVEADVLDDGSMHSFKKEFHSTSIVDFLRNKDKIFEIATPVYPGYDCKSPSDTIELYKKEFDKLQKVLLIHLPTMHMSEQNQLFAYYKIPRLLDGVMKDKQTAWNPDYQSYKDMQIYELREALSFYIDQQVEHLTLKKPDNWLCITTNDILYNFKNTIVTVIDYFGLTVDHSQNIDEFYLRWFQKQQYILNEFDTINNILDHLNTGSDMSWIQLSLMGEAIIQSRLRRQNIEIACYNLNQFPTDIRELKKVLIT